jgi:DNA-binding phage protein
LVEEAARNILNGDVDIALVQLRDVVNATMGFDALAAATGVPKTSLMRMLGPNGNPRAGNLTRILQTIGKGAGVQIVVQAKKALKPEAARVG